MAVVLTGLKVEQFIVHQIPRPEPGSGAKSVPVLSSAPSTLTDALRTFFESKIGDAAASAACFRVEFDPDTKSPVPQLVQRLLGKPSLITKNSQEMAQHLVAAQNAVNSEGLLAAVPFRHGSVKCVALLKLENEDGVRVRREGKGNQQRLELELIDDLLLTRRTKTFKQAVVMNPTKGEYHIWVADHQRGFGSPNPIAAFFLHDFLGCRLMVDPRIATRNFYMAAKEFGDKHVPEDDRVAFDIHLVSYLTENTDSINSAEFATRYLPLADRSAFRQLAEDHDVPSGRFEKNNELIQTKLRSIAYTGLSGVHVRGPVGAMEQRVNFEKSEDGNETVMKIRDQFHSQA